MIKTSYKKLFQVKVLHSYFENNVCSCINITPSAPTLEIMKRFGLTARYLVDGISFYTSSNELYKNYLSYIETVSGKNSFDFTLQSTKSNFDIITDVPTGECSLVNFDSKNKSNTFSNGSLNIIGNYGSKTNADSVATLKIYFKDIVTYSQQEGDLEFAINFKSRSTQWQYYVINKSAIQLDNLKILTKSELQFIGPEKTTIPTGQEALLFSSGKQLIPLHETSKYKFNLVNEKEKGDDLGARNNSYTTVFNALPNPNPEIMATTINQKTKIVSSQMYIYIYI